MDTDDTLLAKWFRVLMRLEFLVKRPSTHNYPWGGRLFRTPIRIDPIQPHDVNTC